MGDSTERWLPVPGYEGSYEISDRGTAYSVLRETGGRQYGGHVLKPGPRGQMGHLAVRLFKAGAGRCFFVHVLVLEAFDRPRPPGLESLHGPGGPLDNRWPENLRWGTKAENWADKIRDGTDTRGSKHVFAKLTEEAVEQIRLTYAVGDVTYGSLAAEFNVAERTIRAVVNGDGWLHAPGPISPAKRKLTEPDVALIKARLLAGATQEEIAVQYGMHQTAISLISTGRTWRNVQPALSTGLSTIHKEDPRWGKWRLAGRCPPTTTTGSATTPSR